MSAPPSGRRIVAFALAFGAIALAFVAAVRALRPVPLPSVTAARDALHAEVRARVLSGDVARPDGWVQTVELGQLLTHAALMHDAELYDALHARIVPLVRDDPSDPYTRGMVAWRWKAGEPPDASGTTEALRVAEGLWRGADAFGREDDRRLARTILDGYTHHARVDRDIWFIANYFNFGTRAFATNSYLVDYDPDLLAEVANATGDPVLAEVAARSYALVDHAVAESGLVYDIVQPEVATLLPTSLVWFSPNDVVPIANSATVASRCVRGRPRLARAVLGFALRQRPALKLAYHGRDGTIAAEGRPGVETWAPLVRVALALGDRTAASTLLPDLMRSLPASGLDLFAASEALLTLDASARASPPDTPIPRLGGG